MVTAHHLGMLGMFNVTWSSRLLVNILVAPSGVGLGLVVNLTFLKLLL